MQGILLRTVISPDALRRFRIALHQPERELHAPRLDRLLDCGFLHMQPLGKLTDMRLQMREQLLLIGIADIAPDALRLQDRGELHLRRRLTAPINALQQRFGILLDLRRCIRAECPFKFQPRRIARRPLSARAGCGHIGRCKARVPERRGDRPADIAVLDPAAQSELPEAVIQ